MTDILPDCRAKEAKGRVFKGSVAWVPVFCANCGADSGSCPEHMEFMFYLCNKCVGTHGEVAGTMMVPDEVFWQQVREAQIAEHGRELAGAELMSFLEREAETPLAKLILEGS